MERFEIIEQSKFNVLSEREMGKIKGGFCLSCKKRARKVELGLSLKFIYKGKHGEIEGTIS